MARAMPAKDSESEIQFGQLEHAQPERGLRPDQDRHYVVAECGQVRRQDLPIFVELDVLRDMEAHARENTRVELGGVMLGRQHLDTDGQPFVLVTESLRAKHYQATKGSFKFTHETWNEITRERNEFRTDLQLVGWYHTHPGWGVFLSGMDLFICNHFFNRPLDIALVIDPSAGDRGWFHWSTADQDKMEPTAGFFLMTNRHRWRELNYYRELFDGPQSRVTDPQLKQASFDKSGFEQEDTMVNVIDNRRPWLEVSVVSLVLLQFMLACFFAWFVLYRTDQQEMSGLREQVSALESRLEMEQQRRNATIREQAYANILETIVSKETGQTGLAGKMADLFHENRLLSENLQGQLARIEKSQDANHALILERDRQHKRAEGLETDLSDTRRELDLAQQALEKQQPGKNDVSGTASQEEFARDWLIYTSVGVGLLVLGLVGGAFLTRQFMPQRENSFDEVSLQTGDEHSETGG